MKTLALTLALVLASSWSAFGKAYFFTRSELIEKATVIAIIQLEEPGPNQKAADPFVEGSSRHPSYYAQQAKARVEKVLKGNIPTEFILYGQEAFICAQCRLSKGRFLAFLKQKGDLWAGANWQLSLRPIRDGQVEWYVSEEQRFPMEFQKLDGVIAQIQAALGKPQSSEASEQIVK